MRKRLGDWIQTYTGRQFWPEDPHPVEVDIADIAHALAHICRFGGHCRTFYSVAQHSLLVAELVEPKLKPAALLHDSAEAYIGDMVRPLKAGSLGAAYRPIERRIYAEICYRFGVRPVIPPAVKVADEIMLATEAKQLMAKPPQAWGLTERPLMISITPLSPNEAEEAFLEACSSFARPVARQESPR